MEHSEEHIENRLKWRATKNGLPKNNSYFFDDLSTEKKREFNTTLDSAQIGKPVLLFCSINNKWTVLGTKMIASGTHQAFDRVAYTEIEKHAIGDDPFGIISVKDFDKKNNFKKIEQHQILIKSKDGKILTLHGPKGEEVFIMYNIILMLIRISIKSE